MAEIRKCIRKDGCCLVKTFFMEYDYLGIEKLQAGGKAMGLVVTSGGEYPVEFAIKRNGEYAPWAHENYLLVWNIKKVEMDSVGFPVPCEDHKGYEHTISGITRWFIMTRAGMIRPW